MKLPVVPQRPPAVKGEVKGDKSCSVDLISQSTHYYRKQTTLASRLSTVGDPFPSISMVRHGSITSALLNEDKVDDQDRPDCKYLL